MGWSAGKRAAMVSALLACGVATHSLGQTDGEQARRRAMRRTPVVDVYENWKDSVVCITGAMVRGKGPSIEEFFKVPKGKQITSSLGSGFVIHEAGYLLTNAHVAEQVIAPLVTFNLRSREYWADVISLDRDHDLALLKIDAGRPLKAVRLAKSRDLMIGETVIVVGNPHGLIRTCTAGVLSATDRSARPDAMPGITLRGLIQSDAGMSPGNSGGPWFNVLGEVIGVSTMGGRGSEWIGFAVPVATVRRALPEMLDVQRCYGLTTGLTVQADEPCKVTAVAAGSPGAKAGVLPGDVLVQVDAKPIGSGADFHLALVGRKPGGEFKLRLLRGGKPYSGPLTLGARPKPDGAALMKRKLGLAAAPLDPAQARAMALRTDRGVRITAVEAGLYEKTTNPPLPGDLLAQIDGIRPRDLDHAGLLLDRLKPHRTIRIVLLRLRGDQATRVDLSVTPRK